QYTKHHVRIRTTDHGCRFQRRPAICSPLRACFTCVATMSEHDLDQLTRELDALGAARADPMPETAADAEPDPVVSFADDLDAGPPPPGRTRAAPHARWPDAV